MADLLVARLNDNEIARVGSGDVPCERTASLSLAAGAVATFEDATGKRHVRHLGDVTGWARFSIRVQRNLACQPDCVIATTETFDPQALQRGDAVGIRFQPFFLAGSTVDPNELVGQGLFKRGLHYPGQVTNGLVRLACECDVCNEGFMVQSFHAGFGNCTYFYSDSSRHTLIVDNYAIPPDTMRDPAARARFEDSLPLAPDGTRFGYLNPFRCPHCGAPYIDFERHPELREIEYYGNTLLGNAPIHFEPPTSSAPVAPVAVKKGWWSRLFR
jgi:hypothetical protein